MSKFDKLAELLKDKGFEIPADVLAEAQADHKAASVEVRERQESNLDEFVSYLYSVRGMVATGLSDGGFLTGTSFVLIGRTMDDGSASVTIEAGHSTGTKKPVHIGSDGNRCETPERNRRDYSKSAVADTADNE